MIIILYSADFVISYAYWICIGHWRGKSHLAHASTACPSALLYSLRKRHFLSNNSHTPPRHLFDANKSNARASLACRLFERLLLNIGPLDTELVPVLAGCVVLLAPLRLHFLQT